MDRTPSDENADNDASNKTPEPDPDELENDIQSDAPDGTSPPPDDDGSSSDKNVINDSEPEPEPESPPDEGSNTDNEPDLENVADEQEGAPEEEAPEEIPDIAEAEEEVPVEEAAEEEASPEEVPVEEAAEDDASPEEVLLEADIEEVPQDALPLEETGPSYGEAEVEPLDENKIADTIIEYIEENVLADQNELDSSDSGHLEKLAEGILTAIISSSVVPSLTELILKEPEDGIAEDRTEDVEEAEEAEVDEYEDESFSMPRKVQMLDKEVQAIAKEIDDELEALSAENLIQAEEGGEVEKTMSAESEGDLYQSCDDDSEVAEEMPCGEGSGNVPCPYMEEMGEEPAEEERTLAADMDDESQWEDLPDEGEEQVPLPVEEAELSDQQESVPQDTSIPSEPQDTYKDSISPKLAPDSVKRIESSGGIKSAPPPPDAFQLRAVASDNQRRAVAQPAVTPRREPCEACEWQQAFCNLKDQLFESPYNYLCKFVILCVAIRTIRNIFQGTRCG